MVSHCSLASAHHGGPVSNTPDTSRGVLPARGVEHAAHPPPLWIPLIFFHVICWLQPVQIHRNPLSPSSRWCAAVPELFSKDFKQLKTLSLWTIVTFYLFLIRRQFPNQGKASCIHIQQKGCAQRNIRSLTCTWLISILSSFCDVCKYFFLGIKFTLNLM